MRLSARNERGAAAVEFAIVLPLLLTILFGTIEWGYYFFTREIVINSAREGARAGTLQYASGTDVPAAACNTTFAYLTNSGLIASKATVLYKKWVKTTGLETCPNNSSCVDVVYTYSSMTGFVDALLGAERKIHIHAYAEMRK